MNYHNITKCDMVNGTGIRVVVWVAGCIHQCKNCHNPQTWDENGGIPFDEGALEEIYECLRDDDYEGITFSGGDPLHPNNRKTILELAKKIKEDFPTKTVWLYSGFQWDFIKTLDNIEYVDVVIDGKYVEELSKPSPQWRGSTNQRIIDVKKSLSSNQVIEKEV